MVELVEPFNQETAEAMVEQDLPPDKCPRLPPYPARLRSHSSQAPGKMGSAPDRQGAGQLLHRQLDQEQAHLLDPRKTSPRVPVQRLGEIR